MASQDSSEEVADSVDEVITGCPSSSTEVSHVCEAVDHCFVALIVDVHTGLAESVCVRPAFIS